MLYNETSHESHLFSDILQRNMPENLEKFSGDVVRCTECMEGAQLQETADGSDKNAEENGAGCVICDPKLGQEVGNSQADTELQDREKGTDEGGTDVSSDADADYKGDMHGEIGIGDKVNKKAKVCDSETEEDNSEIDSVESPMDDSDRDPDYEKQPRLHPSYCFSCQSSSSEASSTEDEKDTFSGSVK